MTMTQPILITADELAVMLKISPRTLWRLLSAGKLLKPVRFGGNTRWKESDVLEWIDQGCPPPERSKNVARR